MSETPLEPPDSDLHDLPDSDHSEDDAADVPLDGSGPQELSSSEE